MVTNYYNAATNCKTPVRREPKPYTEAVTKHEPSPVQKNTHSTPDTDLVIILGLLAVLFLTDCKDYWLMLVLLYLAFG